MRKARSIATALLAVASVMALVGFAPASPAMAQEGPGGLINPGRDCQTIRTCNFARNGRYRGCVSSYSCRVCRPVRAACDFGPRGRACSRFVCTWG